MRILVIVIALLSIGAVAESVTPARSGSTFYFSNCTTEVGIIPPGEYAEDDSIILNPPVYDIYERPPCGNGASCRSTPWQQIEAKALIGDIDIVCSGKPAGTTWRGRACNAWDHSKCSGFSYFTKGGAN